MNNGTCLATAGTADTVQLAIATALFPCSAWEHTGSDIPRPRRSELRQALVLHMGHRASTTCVPTQSVGTRANGTCLATAGTAARAATGPTHHRPLNGLICLTLGIVVFAGCGGDSTRPAASPQRKVNAPPPPPPPPPSAPKKTSAAPKAPPAASKTVQTPAGVGVGDKGRGYGTGPVVTPIAVYFSARERIAFEIQIPEAMNAYKAVEGQGPATHEEFMHKIIEGSQIKLPTLPEGHRYLYDPETEQLMVEKPAE